MTPDVIFASEYIDDSIRSQVEGAGAKVIVFAASDLEGVEQNILTAGQVLNLNGEAKEITDGMEAEMAQLQEILSANTEEKSRVYRSGRILQRREGSLLGNMLEDIGVRNVAADTGEMWPQHSVEKINRERSGRLYFPVHHAEERSRSPGCPNWTASKMTGSSTTTACPPEADMIQRGGSQAGGGNPASGGTDLSGTVFLNGDSTEELSHRRFSVEEPSDIAEKSPDSSVSGGSRHFCIHFCVRRKKARIRALAGTGEDLE